MDAAGLGRAALNPSALAPVDEFHIRGRAASLEIVEALRLTADSHVLDLGSGLDGVGEATATGLPDAAVDAALTDHAAMNIPDEPAPYAEAFRVWRSQVHRASTPWRDGA